MNTIIQQFQEKITKDIKKEIENKLRELGEIDNRKPDGKGKKKPVSKLYIEADKDHISLQNGKNTMVKLVLYMKGKR